MRRLSQRAITQRLHMRMFFTFGVILHWSQLVLARAGDSIVEELGIGLIHVGERPIWEEETLVLLPNELDVRLQGADDVHPGVLRRPLLHELHVRFQGADDVRLGVLEWPPLCFMNSGGRMSMLSFNKTATVCWSAAQPSDAELQGDTLRVVPQMLNFNETSSELRIPCPRASMREVSSLLSLQLTNKRSWLHWMQ